MRIVELSRSTSAPITFLLVDQSSPIFFSSNAGVMAVNQVCFQLLVDLLICSGDIGNQTLKLSKMAHTVDFGWVNNCVCNFFVGGPKFTNFWSNTEAMAVNQLCFQLLMHVLIRSGDICDQTLKLFKIARTVDFG